MLVLLPLLACGPRATVVSWPSLSRSHTVVHVPAGAGWSLTTSVGGEHVDRYLLVPEGCHTVSVSGEDGLQVDTDDAHARREGDTWTLLDPEPTEGVHVFEVYAHPVARYTFRITSCEG
ncbi:MAG: hypothetical protein H6736_22685 [Alphaproteobacteria bacterium]|nr:hypothetical protein [Alphaproteobacteria bacterium]MCB9694627.1 hypothetical protein [Alphaproteobacteria bacterium]